MLVKPHGMTWEEWELFLINLMRRRRRRRGVVLSDIGGAVGPTQALSSSTFVANSPLNTVIGTLSVTNGTGTYTYTFLSNPGTLFNISGSSLRTTSTTIAAGSYSVTIRADNGSGSVIDTVFLLTATAAAGSAALKFNFASNSQYIALLEDI